MSKDYSEFKRLLGADPTSRDPDLLAARKASPELEQAAREADELERKLNHALRIAAPEDLLANILAVTDQSQVEHAAPRRHWMPFALAATLLLAVGATGIVWNLNRGAESVEDYLVAHYAMDGAELEAKAAGQQATNVQAILAEVDYEARPEFARLVGFIKYCPTPDGKGVHMVLNTERGPVTVILMPTTSVDDGESRLENGMQAQLVSLSRGSIAVMGADAGSVEHLASRVRESILPSASASV
jgi:hypothetical protein